MKSEVVDFKRISIVSILGYMFLWGITAVIISAIIDSKWSSVINDYSFYIFICIWVKEGLFDSKANLKSLIGKPSKKFRLWKSVVYILMIIIGSIVLNGLFSYAIIKIYPSLTKEVMNNTTRTNVNYSTVYNSFMVVFLVIVAPIIEEITFRGLILNKLLSKYSASKAIFIVSLLFGLGHGINFLSAFFVGFGLSVLYIKSRTLLLPIICHMLNNGFVRIAEFLPVENSSGIEQSFPILEILIVLFFSAIVIFFIIKNWPQKNWTSPYFDFNIENEENSLCK